MIERLEGIVTDLVKHNDTHNVVTLFTRTRGRMAFLVPVGKSKSGKMRNALLS
ncbi:MAG: recombination protein O N-terminal domain-containing protein, partial [Muribaculaceae bacterium]|nr:recombination protein O N-terminal domain-containing protein [Muribaculaceae bacterium]